MENLSAPGRRSESTDIESRFQALVQSPLRAALLRFFCARPEEAFDVEALMQTFGRMRLDVENCIRELVAFGVAHRIAGGGTPRYAFAQPEQDAVRDLLDQFLERRATVTPRGSLAVGPALPRDDRPRREDARRLRVDPHRGEVRHLGADPRPDRLGQGSGGADDPRVEPPRHQQVPGRQLRRAAGYAVRVGDLRLREGRVHRRPRPQARPPRARQQRHAVPRRDRRPLDHRAGEAAARARGAALRAPRRQHVDRGRTSA